MMTSYRLPVERRSRGNHAFWPQPQAFHLARFYGQELSSRYHPPRLRMWRESIYNALFLDSNVQYGCSDHNSWNDAGFPAACISEAGPNDPGLNPNMHTTGDVASILNFDAMATFVKAGLAWVVEMAQ